VNKLKILILIVILLAIVAVALLINYSKRFSPPGQPITLPTDEKFTPLEEEKLKGEETKEVKIVEIEKIKDEITAETKGEIIEYWEEYFYSEGDFAIFLENQEEFNNRLINEFKQEIIEVTAENCKVDLYESKKSAILKCDIKGARYGTNSYDMHFLLGNWPFDLMNFSRGERKLTYEGEINGIPTLIVFEFPYVLSHCHEHIWPK